MYLGLLRGGGAKCELHGHWVFAPGRSIYLHSNTRSTFLHCYKFGFTVTKSQKC